MGVAFGNCSKTKESPVAVDQVGSGELALTVATGVTVNALTYTISGNGITPITGTIDVSASGDTIALFVGGIPTGGPYTITLAGDSTPAGTHCEGTASGWSIGAGATTSVMLVLQCSGADDSGSVMVNGTINNCPVITSLIASPTTVTVGGSIALVASGSDTEGSAGLTYAWSVTGGGTFSAPASASTSYTCTPAGAKTLRLTLSDGSCTRTKDIVVTCGGGGGGSDAGAPDGGTAMREPYLLPVAPGVITRAFLNVGDSVNNKPNGSPYRLVGLPDGMGAYDNDNETFTLLVNHEAGATAGITRAHGAAGAFVSKWVINKSDLTVLNGSDLITSVSLWSPATSSYLAPAPGPAFTRFCGAELAALSAFYDAASGLGYNGRIYLNGEEGGPGRAMAHTTTGSSWELPRLGKQAWENQIAHPGTGIKTVVAGTDDTTPGQVYIYIGTKQATGTPVEAAGLTNGALYGVAVTGFATEVSATGIPAGTAFTLASLGNVENLTDVQLDAAATTAGVTRFLRPEDGNWDPSNPNDFYFVTTNSFTAPSRLWRLRFTDINNPTAGGTITAVLNGAEGHKMLDNITVDKKGHIYLQEDPGNQAYLAKIWRYTIATGTLVTIAEHNPAFFVTGAPGFLTQDEETSGIFDASDLIGPGWFLINSQAHAARETELIEGGQLLAIFDPAAQ